LLIGLAILIEYVLAPVAIVILIGSAVEALIGINGPWVYAAFYVVFIAMHLVGAGEALKVMMVITVFAVFAIIATAIALLADFDASLLFDIPVTDAVGASTLCRWAGMVFDSIANCYVVIISG
jgi:ethanolamine permease